MFSVGWMCGSVYFANHGQMNSGWGEGMVASGANIQRFCPVTVRVETKIYFPKERKCAEFSCRFETILANSQNVAHKLFLPEN